MDLALLKGKMNFKWKVQTVSKSKPKAQCVAYVDARDVMDMFDKVCGPENWQDDYKLVGDRLLAGIGVKTDSGWVWKWDTGTAGNFEAEKSEISDAFKRASVKWGVGRFLYDLDFEWVDTNAPGAGAYPVRPDSLERIWDLTEYINSKQKYQNKLKG